MGLGPGEASSTLDPETAESSWEGRVITSATITPPVAQASSRPSAITPPWLFPFSDSLEQILVLYALRLATVFRSVSVGVLRRSRSLVAKFGETPALSLRQRDSVALELRGPGGSPPRCLRPGLPRYFTTHLPLGLMSSFVKACPPTACYRLTLFSVPELRSSPRIRPSS